MLDGGHCGPQLGGCHRAAGRERPPIELTPGGRSTPEPSRGQKRDVCNHDVFVAWAHLRLTHLELAMHVDIKYVVPSSQPEQNNLLWSVQVVKAV